MRFTDEGPRLAFNYCFAANMGRKTTRAQRPGHWTKPQLAPRPCEHEGQSPIGLACAVSARKRTFRAVTLATVMRKYRPFGEGLTNGANRPQGDIDWHPNEVC